MNAGCKTRLTWQRGVWNAIRKYFHVCVFLLLIASVGRCTAQPETLTLKLGLDWRALHTRQERGHVTIDYLRMGEDPNHWTELFTYQNGPLRGKHTPEEEFETLKADGEKRCPGAMQWNVIAQDDHSILFESQSTHCLDDPDKHVIFRILHGRHNFFALFYVAAGHDLTPETRTNWIGTLGDATVDPADKDAKGVGPLDVDEVIPFEMDKVMAALTPAMERSDCNVKEETTTRVECKRPRNANGYEGSYGGESVTAVLEPQGTQTRVRITTGKGFYGRLGKESWSIAVFEATMKNLQTAK